MKRRSMSRRKQLLCALFTLFLAISVGAVMYLVGKGASEGIDCQLVVVIFRHGERTPLMTYPTDPYKDKWTRGLGQITNVGTQQAFKLGQFIKARYRKLLSDTYRKDELMTLSSVMDRTLTTAQAVLAGLYPPVKDQVWNWNLSWQPIPVVTSPEKTNWMFMTGYCPAYDNIFHGYMTSNELKHFIQEKQGLMDFLTQETGTSISCLNLVDRFYDTMLVYKAMHLNYPSFVNTTIYSEMEEVHKTLSSLFVKSLEQLRLKIGPLLQSIRNFMQKSLENQSKKKLILYSGNDYLIAAILNALNVSDFVEPKFTAAIFIELYSTANNQTSIKIYYQNNRDVPVTKVTSPSCPSPCSFSQFNNTIAKIIPDNIIEECQVPFEKLKTFWKLDNLSPLTITKT